jgi:hypothetical protein
VNTFALGKGNFFCLVTSEYRLVRMWDRRCGNVQECFLARVLAPRSANQNSVSILQQLQQIPAKDREGVVGEREVGYFGKQRRVCLLGGAKGVTISQRARLREWETKASAESKSLWFAEEIKKNNMRKEKKKSASVTDSFGVWFCGIDRQLLLLCPETNVNNKRKRMNKSFF